MLYVKHPQNHRNMLATFFREFVAKNLQILPNLVTLISRYSEHTNSTAKVKCT